VAQVDRLGSVNISSDVAVANAGVVSLITPEGPIASVSVAAGGTGYTVGDVLSLDNSTGGSDGFGGTVTVLTAPGGVVGSVSLLNPGNNYNSGVGALSYATTGGSGAADCLINVSSIEPTRLETRIHGIHATVISNVAGNQIGTVSILEANAVLWKNYCPMWTAIAAGEGKTSYFPVGETFLPRRVLRVRYNAILNATTAAVNVVWSRGRE
jgi:hypothetical protein